MARLNIEDEFWSDQRFRVLVSLVKSEDIAIGLCIRAWRMAQKYWGESESLIPPKIWALVGLDQLLEVDLAENRPEGIYVKGSKEHFDWYMLRMAAAKKGGLASAKTRRGVKRQANAKQTSSKRQANSTFGQANVKQTPSKRQANSTFGQANVKQTPSKRQANSTFGQAKLNPLTLTLTPTLTQSNPPYPPEGGCDLTQPPGQGPSPDPMEGVFSNLRATAKYGAVFEAGKDRALIEAHMRRHELSLAEMEQITWELRTWADGPSGEKMKSPRGTLTTFVKNYLKQRPRPKPRPKTSEEIKNDRYGD